MITVRFDTRDLQKLADPGLIQRAQGEMIDKGIDVLVPLVRAEAPSRTGRGRAQIAGRLYSGATPYGVVGANKAFYLRILATGTYKKAGGYPIEPFRFKSKTKSRRAARAFGPGGSRGAIAALRFRFGGGGYLFRTRVQHPGLKPDDFFQRAALRGEAPVGHAAEVVVQRALDQATRG